VVDDVGLLEGLEQAGLLLGVEADAGVAHRELEQHVGGSAL
jgi:hypothetical protein